MSSNSSPSGHSSRSDKPAPLLRGPILVTAAIIRKAQQILISQRRFDAKIAAGLWEFPGGKVEPGENLEPCLIREIKEELGIQITVNRLFDVHSHVYQEDHVATHVVLICYLCDWLSGEVEMLEVADAKWIAVGELKDFRFAPADVKFVDQLLQKA